jgi:hypothetical protein
MSTALRPYKTPTRVVRKETALPRGKEEPGEMSQVQEASELWWMVMWMVRHGPTL